MRFLGVDVHLNILTVAEIDKELNIGLMKNMNIDEFNHYIENTQILVAGIDAPYKLNQGLMNNEVYRYNLSSKINGHYNKKVSEYELSCRGINPFSTPDSIENVRSKSYLSWMETGFKVYENLERHGYMLLNDININMSNSKGMAEVFPHASFTVLAGRLLFNKNTEEGINERIKVLEEQGFKGIEQYFENIKKKDKDDYLDALVAAFTAFKVWSGKGMFVGDVAEGQIALPVCKVKDSYKRIKKNKIVIAQNVKVDTNIRDREYEYKVKHCDSVLWLKHFIPIGPAPDIRELLKYNSSQEVKVNITSENNDSIDVTLINLKNRKDGLKVSKEFKNLLKDFWGSNGNGKNYILKIKI